MSRNDEPLDDDDAPPSNSGTLTSAEATRILFRDPGVRNYLFAGLASLALVFVVLFQRGADIGGLLIVLIGVAGLLLRKSAAAPLFVLVLTYFVVFPFGFPEFGYASRFEIEDNRFNFSDILLIGSALTFLACLYRVLGMTQQALPHEMKLPRKIDKPYRRPPSAITDTEIPRLLYLAAGMVFVGQILWLIVSSLEVAVGETIPLRITESSRSFRSIDEGTLPPGTTRFVLTVGLLFFGTLLARLVLGYWRLRRMKPDEASMVLLDTGWTETRRERVRIEVWRRWQMRKNAEREAKQRKGKR